MTRVDTGCLVCGGSGELPVRPIGEDAFALIDCGFCWDRNPDNPKRAAGEP